LEKNNFFVDVYVHLAVGGLKEVVDYPLVEETLLIAE
jgi:hypothetical protein